MLIQTSRRDNNYFSLSNNITNLTGIAEVPWPDPLVFEPVDFQNYDAILKICDHSSHINLSDLKVAQGKEAAVDINNKVSDVSLQGEFGTIGTTGNQVITVKGGSHDIKISGIINSRGTVNEVTMGRWADQSYDITYNVDLSELRRTDGDKIRVIIGRATKPNLGPNCRILFWLSLGEKIYWWAKFILVKLVKKFPMLAKPFGFTVKT